MFQHWGDHGCTCLTFCHAVADINCIVSAGSLARSEGCSSRLYRGGAIDATNGR